MNILCIETATDICSVCISQNGSTTALRENREGNQHSRVLTLLVAESVAAAGLSLREIDAVALSAGPGSYTSLRVGTSVAKGLCYALDKPLIAIGTLESLAHAVRDSGVFGENTLFAPMVDARRMEVFTATFDMGLREVGPARPLVIAHNSFEKELSGGRQLVICGNGAAKCRPVLSHPSMVFLDMTCSAANLSLLAFSYFQNKVFQSIAYFEPTYMKPPNITVPANPLIINQMEKIK